MQKKLLMTFGTTVVRPVGAELFHAGGRTGTRDNANSRYL